MEASEPVEIGSEVQESRGVRMGSAVKTNSYCLAGTKGFSPFYKIPLRGPIHFSFSLEKNANKILFF